MGALTEIGNLLIQTFFYLYLLAVLLRFLLQVARADFYNPISQFLVKATNPLLKPLRRIIPGVMGIDMSSIVLVLLLQMVATCLLLLINGLAIINPLVMMIWAIIGSIGMIVNIYFFAIIISIIVSWIAPGSYNPAILLIHQITEPVMAPFRNLIPSMGGIDISPIIVIFAIKAIQILLSHAAAAMGLYPALVVGM
jgi:YggT family protein